MEFAVSVINTGAYEVGENVVCVGSAYQFVDRQSHTFSKITCKNIAEVTGGNAYVYALSELDVALLEKLAICVEVVYYLRSKSCPVYRVCT